MEGYEPGDIPPRSVCEQTFLLINNSVHSFNPCLFEISAPHFKDGKMEGDSASHLFKSSFGSKKNLKSVLINMAHPDRQNTCAPEGSLQIIVKFSTTIKFRFSCRA